MSDSITEWLGRLHSGEEDAARRLWEWYSDELLSLARQRLNEFPRAAADEEDIAQSVFASVCRAAAAGRFKEVKSRGELWWLLLAITKQKIVNHVRRETAQKRGAGRVRCEADLQPSGENGITFSLEDVVAGTPTAEFLVALEEEFERLLAMLREETLREIAVARIEGYSVAEISAKMGIGLRAVERKLQLIRSKWSREFGERDDPL
jgi:RNA polymerase sigma factor (sigma-70 family)